MSIQEELERLYWRIVHECEASWKILEAFQALSETIEYCGGGQHFDYNGRGC